MTAYETPEDAEDAYYDAIDESDLEKMMSVWSDASQTVCLLPMQPMQHGKQAIRGMWQAMLNPSMRVDITVNHLQWSNFGEIAIHVVEESVLVPAMGERQPPIYATNIFHKVDDGWRMLMHLNSPAPPPEGMMPPGMPGQ
ncbi:YybH family protein [Solemya velesiana gill symbiont]|uniref:Ketosteroid isomerase n=1 Tax=Solemya velesiana gill symbiont TaxID=1918948 RepID=A0A1T2KXB7_9GAMM|nr:nuclear transport factor 2 family protein [Solemya velesiana gill symbiont]OOZ37495.1 ketosteroid isomerase [Solemya velesiana gill symbiont]